MAGAGSRSAAASRGRRVVCASCCGSQVATRRGLRVLVRGDDRPNRELAGCRRSGGTCCRRRWRCGGAVELGDRQAASRQGRVLQWRGVGEGGSAVVMGGAGAVLTDKGGATRAWAGASTRRRRTVAPAAFFLFFFLSGHTSLLHSFSFFSSAAADFFLFLCSQPLL
ncbi:hypothetical protein EUGRSUZ_A02302 [Eucalyptus grandis]|uniref:Uncharacterized protein n=2 Tax=Eucalyptus grandis TaxID=71139 RepID=A0A059DHR5_EUCGR|nr:hypothetical protein EUGRSUZ_A02302 [Eucalyptus grandis]